MEIKVLGPGCAKCVALEKVVKEAAQELGISDPVVKVSELQEILALGVMSTPALVINGKVIFSGRVPSKDDIKVFLQG